MKLEVISSEIDRVKYLTSDDGPIMPIIRKSGGKRMGERAMGKVMDGLHELAEISVKLGNGGKFVSDYVRGVFTRFMYVPGSCHAVKAVAVCENIEKLRNLSKCMNVESDEQALIGLGGEMYFFEDGSGVHFTHDDSGEPCLSIMMPMSEDERREFMEYQAEEASKSLKH